MGTRRTAAAQPQGAAFFPLCGCARARGAAAEPSESYEDAADVDPSRASHSSASSRGLGGTDSKTIASQDSEVQRRQEQRPYPRLMVSAARAVGVHIEGRQRAAGAATAGRGRGQSPWARALDFSGFIKKAKSFESALGVKPRWIQFASWETVMGPNRLPIVREVIKVNLRPASNQHPEDPREAVVKQLLAKPAHFPHGVHTIELTCCGIDTVPSTVAGHGELKVLRLSKNVITELPKGWLGPETKASRSRSNTSLGSRAASGVSSWANWISTRSRSLSPSFCSPASARGGREARRRSSPRRPSPCGSPSRPHSSRRRKRSSSGDSTPGDEAVSSPRRRSVEELSPSGWLDTESRPEGGPTALPVVFSARREGSKEEQSSPRASPGASPSAASLSPTSPRDSPRTARKSALKDTSSPVVHSEKRRVKLTLRTRSEKSPPPKSPSAHSSSGTGKSSARWPTTPLSTFTRKSQRKGTDRSGESGRSGRSGRSWMSRVSVFLTGRQKWERPTLEELRLDRNAITIVERGALGSAIARGLTILDLAHNRLSSLPPDFLEGCRSLRYLDLSFNELDEVPQLTDEHLCQEDESAEEDSAEGGPAGRGERKSRLEILLLDSNRLQKLPDKLPQGLRRLSASYNGLTELPEQIGKLRQLESLRLASNKIRVLPPSAIHLWPGKRSGGSLSHLQIEDNPLVQPSITAFQLGGMDAAFDLFDQWLSGKEAQPAPRSALAELPPLWATSLESLRFPGFFLGEHDGGALLAARAATGAPSAPPSMRMREYAGDVVSLEADSSRGRLATAGSGDDEYREVILATVKEGLDASSHFRMRAFPDGLVTFESMGFPGFFLNVYGSKESRKSVQLVLDEPSNPRTQSWGFFRMARARISSTPLGEPRGRPAACSRPPRLERFDEDDDRALSPLSAASNKRRSISPVRTLIHGINSIRRITSSNAPSVNGAASNKEGAGRVAIHTNSVRSGGRARSPTAGSRQRRE